MIRFGTLPLGILTLEVISLSPNHILTPNDVDITKTTVWRRSRPLSAGFTLVYFFLKETREKLLQIMGTCRAVRLCQVWQGFLYSI